MPDERLARPDDTPFEILDRDQHHSGVTAIPTDLARDLAAAMDHVQPSPLDGLPNRTAAHAYRNGQIS
jgi:hypothetical protein